MINKGFTLIELLVVIGILAILATATALILNPAELLRESRDSTRIADLGTLRAAIDLFLSDQLNPSLGSSATTGTLCTAAGGAGVTKGSIDCPASANVIRLTNGTGWVSINFGLIGSGSPVSRLPLDPNNNTGAATDTDACGVGGDRCYYQYIYDNAPGKKEYEIVASMESKKFSKNGSNDVESNTKDGGSDDEAYEIGNRPNLNL